MSFIPDDCHNIIMDCPPTGASQWAPQYVSRALSADDLRRFADAGARVALEFCPWHLVEPSRGVYDWAMPDDMVSRCRRAGMRVMLMGPTTVPLWCPDEWYVWDVGGRPMRDHDPRNWQQTWGCLSPWNAEAMDYYAGFVRAMQARYGGGDVLVIHSLSQEGESILPPAIPCFYDPAATASYKARMGDARAVPRLGTRSTTLWLHESLARAITELQRVYVGNPWGEVWMSQHPVYYGPAWGASGVSDIPGLWRAVIRGCAPVHMGHIVFAYYDNGFEDYAPSLVRELLALGVSVVVGGEWCTGLKRNTPRAKREGIRALLTAPIHPYTGKADVEPWMVDAVGQSAAALAEAALAEAALAEAALAEAALAEAALAEAT